MGKDADSGGKVQAMVPPFIYLSDAMQQYASCKVPIASDVETAGDLTKPPYSKAELVAALRLHGAKATAGGMENVAD